MPKINEMFAFVAEDNGPEDEGVIAVSGMPLVGADMARVKSLWKVAEQVARDHKKNIRVLKFSVREQIGFIRGAE